MLSMRIRKARSGKGLTQAQLADRLKVGRSAVANWECGAKAPTSTRLRQLALVTEVSFEWLATGRGKSSPREDWILALDAEIVDDPTEIKLLCVYRACAAADRRAVFEFMASRSPAARRALAEHRRTTPIRE